MQGPESDEKMQPIQWTERPTGAFVGVGLMWPKESSLLEYNFGLFIITIFVIDRPIKVAPCW
jgi:hypothetical protein